MRTIITKKSLNIDTVLASFEKTFANMSAQIEVLKANTVATRSKAVAEITTLKNEAGERITELEERIAGIEKDLTSQVSNLRSKVHQCDNQMVQLRGIAKNMSLSSAVDEDEVDLTKPVSGE